MVTEPPGHAGPSSGSGTCRCCTASTPPNSIGDQISPSCSWCCAFADSVFPDYPRAALVSAIYPFLGYWLLWGGSVWFPVSVVLGFVIGYLLIVGISERANLLAAIICGVLGTVLYWLFLAGSVAQVAQSMVPIGLVEVQSDRFGGFMLSTTIGVTGIACSLPIGILLALGRRSDLLIVKAICVGFIELYVAFPLITLLFVASTLLQHFLPPHNFDLILRVVIMVTLFSSPSAEVVRGGLAALAPASSRPLMRWASTTGNPCG